jgi:predicted DCC family thiol-disulfide oxidoreductase YuxK
MGAPEVAPRGAEGGTGVGGGTGAGARPGTRSGPAAAGGRPALRSLTVLYDPECRLCAFVSGWLRRQRKLVPVALVPVGSERARRLFPDLDHEGATRREVTVVGDAGQVYTGDSAWVVCLWALRDHRALSHTLTGPAGRRLARAAVLGAAKYREAQNLPRPRRRSTAHPGAPYAGRPPHGGPALTGRGAGPVVNAAGAPAGPVQEWVYAGDGEWKWRDPVPQPPPGVPARVPPCGDGRCPPPR